MDILNVLSDLELRQKKSIKKVFEFLRIKSISTDSAYGEECKRAAIWISKEIETIGLSSKCYTNSLHPIVFGSSKGFDPTKPTYLFYGHYDVQPVDPLSQWTYNPFEPRICDIDGRKVIHGRGSSDDKGQILTFIEACRSVISIFGELPFNLKVLIEGEEECGSPSIKHFLESHKSDLSCDYAIICDTGFEQGKPAIYTMLRGEISQKIKIKSASKDLHSGIYGGAATNPIRILSEILSKLHDKNGKIQIPNFYDDVSQISLDLRKQWKSLNFNEENFLKSVGLSIAAGEKEYSLLENLWSRPSCEITGISGGYYGEGFKTVIPSEATASISFRLVDAQDPEKVKGLFQKFVRRNLPSDCKVYFESKYGTKASIVSSESKLISIAKEALEEEWAKCPILAGSGASIPIVTDLKNILNVDSLLIGFGQDTDNIHAPNENYDLESFIKGSNTWARIIVKIQNS